jgi:hypothetical protein
MSKRTFVMVVALVLLAAAGAVVYIYSTPKATALAEDCEDKPKPKNEFAMAAECDSPPPVRPPLRPPRPPARGPQAAADGSQARAGTR